MTVPIILDVDTGVDDACAVLLAALHPDLELQAVTCVGGNASVDDVVRNTLKVLDVAGRRDVPVARGAANPLLEPGREARHVHGDDGMADLGWPSSDRHPEGRHSVELLRDLLSAAAKGGPAGRITLVPLAPLTNIALLLLGRFGEPDATIGDAGAVCAVIDRSGLTTTRLPVRVELAGTYSRGRTIVDRRDWAGDLAHDPHGIASVSMEVALAVDAAHYAQLWLRTFTEAGR